jgi:L-aminoadipate-semialdehyde dehydrogenase
MPLTPNGKVDKNQLPFPDTALQADIATRSRSGTNSQNFTPIQQSMREIWAELLGINSDTIQLEDNFFDLGGHSILATRLIFELRKSTAVELPLGLVYKSPVLTSMCQDIEYLRGGDLNMNRPEQEVVTQPEFDYAQDLLQVNSEYIKSIPMTEPEFEKIIKNSPTFFVTGVTGFLGAFILSELLQKHRTSKIIVLVRAKSKVEALSRVVENLKRHLCWDEQFSQNLTPICGDLGIDRFNLNANEWLDLCQKVDVIIHNGALVHWVYPYQKLRAPNVIGTQTCLKLAVEHHTKPMHFVSSTSVLDTEHYSKKLVLQTSVYENDDLEGSRFGLKSGYGQTKWVAEKLVMNAMKNGVPCTIIRPGYIVGDSIQGVTNTDDFIWRIVKGCVELGQAPKISNVVNMCSVDYVAGCVIEVASSFKSFDLRVFHTWNSNVFKFDDLFSSLVPYKVKLVEYVHWKTALMNLTLSRNDHALFPLLHFVLDDLPTSTKSPELDDANMRKVLKGTKVRSGKMQELLPLYLGYLCHVGFLDNPEVPFPSLDVWKTLTGGIVTRSGG